MDLRSKVFTTVLQYAPTALEAARTVYNAVKRVRTPFKAWNRRHAWQSYRKNDEGVLERVPIDYCIHCTSTRTADNENTKCPGPPGWR